MSGSASFLPNGLPSIPLWFVAVNSLLILRNLRAKRRATDPSNVPNDPSHERTLRRLASKLDGQAIHLLGLFLLHPVLPLKAQVT